MKSRAKRKNDSRTKRSGKSARRVVNRVGLSITDAEAIALTRYEAGLPLKTQQLALVIGISRSQIYLLGEKGPPFTQVKRGVKASRRLYFAKDVEPWLRKHTANIQPDGDWNEHNRK